MPELNIVNNIQEYLESFQTPYSEYADILVSAVSAHSADIYNDPEKLKEAMQEAGATEIQIEKVHLMTMCTGFREVLEMDSRTQQVDIDRFVKNARKETGFTKPQVLELTSGIIASLGIEGLTDYRKPVNSEPDESGYVVPYSVYEEEMRIFEEKINNPDSDGFSSEDMTRLEVLAKAGITRAKYYLGCCLLNDEYYENSMDLGLEYLEEAASEGDELAAGVLGDYYYDRNEIDSWSNAYSNYTGYGSLALNGIRRERIANIMNYEKFNKKVIVLDCILLVAMLLTVIIAPGSAVYAPHRVWGFICFILELGIAAIHILFHRQYPFATITWAPCGMFAIWFLYILVRILF